MSSKTVLILAFTFFVVYGSECQAPQNSTCDLEVYKCCDQRFREHVGIGEDVCAGETVDHPYCMQQALNLALYTHGRHGISKVSSAYNDFRDCLGQTLRSCTTAEFYLKNRHGFWESKGIQALYAGLNFICGPGLETLLVNEPCILKTYRTHFAELHQCTVQFENNVRRDIKDACTYERELTGCYELTFRKECSAEVAWWSCEHQRSYASGFLPHCDSQCVSHQNYIKAVNGTA
ncbi:unnamed protein product [Bursaphelenchus okinawaensis]|uniref:DUF19 domain-containing protein n=1 Tax=Bursaphelenchus okinawaensis TaxID=465554 RepID=A0A811KZH9_9BILA|nr:unnamed protein product [Bursaphelenchus okinawaensis]CAG9113470.1 unnamed protein product [Bursaphelenchus okinawaensis]